MTRRWLPFPLAVLLAACGTDERATVDDLPRNPFAPDAIPAALRGDGTPIKPSDGLTADMRNDAGTVWNPDEIEYTDPDAENPDNIVPELRKLLDSATTEGPWRRSYTAAFREARKTNTPVLMWFTDSQNSPNCKALSEDLFSKQEFEEWASQNFVRLQVDQRVGSKLEDEGARKSDWVQALKKRYKVFGNPTLLVLTPAGEVIGRYKGYRRGQWEYRWGQLRQGADLARKSHADWIKKMEKKGYRTWHDPRGRSFFAKLIAYRDGELVLIEPDGTRAQTKERYLSPEDQDWIAAQKRARGIE
ncbi:hypothetical protein HAHE_38560 [Haloferula helveola]|uniref:Thioredoxin-like fold domain-containing protein n=1 Tax=Haloferula helveola TaxID=490095 RepID=A0ABN6H9U1_9BACT|nr:hypothetical protein HAHE_38560 [Haloferula helveola]